MRDLKSYQRMTYMQVVYLSECTRVRSNPKCKTLAYLLGRQFCTIATSNAKGIEYLLLLEDTGAFPDVPVQRGCLSRADRARHARTTAALQSVSKNETNKKPERTVYRQTRNE
jgi:hypothetical protein